MKHVLTSAGLLAFGAVSLHALDPEMTRQQTGRPFSVAATVRGFYDDNVNTSPDKIVMVERDDTGVIISRKVSHPRQSSYGFEVSPSAHLNLPLEQTFISLGYVYSLKWYENREPNSIDQSHEFSGKLRHQFSPRHQIGVDDSFVVTSEPTVVDRFGIITDPALRQQTLRSRSSVLHNLGSIEDNIGLTRLLSLSLGYANSWYDYEASGPGSRSALLDRIEQSIRGDLRYQFTPKVVGLVGYTFGFNNFTGNDFLFAAPTTLEDGTVIHPKSKTRDSYSHKMYVGADYDITAQLRASARVGAEYSDYHEVGDSALSPYADASLTYVYLPGDSLEVGVRHQRNATDVAAVDIKTGRPTLDAETTALYAQLMHHITYNLTASLIGQYQMSTFNDGVSNGQKEDLWLVGVNFEYRFNRHWSTELGYNYDTLKSDLAGRNYDRNRVYIGVRATY